MIFFIKLFISPIIFLYDVFLYIIVKKKNSDISYKFFLYSFCLTGGKSNTILDFVLSKSKRNIPSAVSFVTNVNEVKAQYCLSKYGFYYVKNAIDLHNINLVKKYLDNIKGKYISDSYNSLNDEYFQEQNPKAIKFIYNSNDLIECESIQKLVVDKNLYNIASNYFGKEPILDTILAYWSVPSEKPDSNAAQMWHFDLERTKWLKIFIYLTDCDENNGPHYFIEKSHLDGGINYEIRKKGYKRVEDELIDKFYKKEQVRRFTSPAGGLLIEDTRGLHKGKKVDQGSRLILQFQYSTNLFGANTAKIAYPHNQNTNFKKYIINNKFFFSNFT